MIKKNNPVAESKKFIFLLFVLSSIIAVPAFADGKGMSGYEGEKIFVSQPPGIISFSPASGPVGTLLTITGSNLNNPSSLLIGGVPAILISNTGTKLVAMVMPGAFTGNVEVGAATASSQFRVTSSQPVMVQQGSKLKGYGGVGHSERGASVSISADGNTAIVGGYQDNNFQGAAWIFTRSNDGTWSPQGNKLVGTDMIGQSHLGASVSISADGNTVIVGGAADNNNQGAAWIFIRSNGFWAQEGSKLVGMGAVGNAAQGTSVSISADGNTSTISGPGDNNGQGATWVFTRSNGIWSQEGSKLTGTGAVGNAGQGSSVSISADGNTAIVGGYGDNNSQGATWVFTRSNGIWSQEGGKLFGTGVVGYAQQGESVSISADGNTAIISGRVDDNFQGAVWVFTRNNGSWSQQGSKLVGTGTTDTHNTEQGCSVSISADGNTAIVGGNHDNNFQGATWLFTRSNGIWSQQGSKLVGLGALGIANPSQGTSVSISADGNTMIVGGPNDDIITGQDNSIHGSAWVFTNINSLNIQIISSDQNVCQNSVAPSLFVTPLGNAVDNFSYQWYSNTISGNSGGVLIPGANASSFSPPTSTLGTTYYYCGVNRPGGAIVTTNVSGAITVIENVVAGAITGVTSVCPGETTTLHDTTAGGTWSSDNTSIAFVDASGLVIGITEGTATISYMVSNANGCQATSTVLVTVNPLPVLSSTIGSTSLCTGQTSPLSNATTGGTWRSDNVSVASIDASGVVTGISAGVATVYYKVTNVSGCSMEISEIITVYELPPGSPISGTDNVQTGSSITLSDASAGGVWSSSNISVAKVNSSGVVKGINAGQCTITYTITNATGCSLSTSKIVTVYMPLSVSVQASTILCNGETSILTITVIGGSGNFSYRLSNGTYQTSNTFTVTPGNYQVIVKDNVYALQGNVRAQVTQPIKVFVLLINSTKPSRGLSDGSFTVAGFGGSFSSYSYSIDGIHFQSSGTFSNLAAGTYYVYVTDGNNCFGRNILTVVLKEKPITRGNAVSIHSGGKISTSTEETYVELLDAKVYPNPTLSEFTLFTSSSVTQKIEIQVCDITGRMVYRMYGEVNNTYRFGQNFALGTYIVKVMHKDGMKVIKVVKQ